MRRPLLGSRARLGGIALVAFLASAVLASSGALPGEVGATEAFSALPEVIIDVLAIVVQLGTSPMILVVAAVVVVVGPGDWRRAGLAVVLAGAVSWGIANLAKEVVERPRPAAYSSEVEIRDDASGLGWPSSHTAIAAGTLTAAALVSRRRPSAAILLAGAVGVGRMAVGVHLPLDVVGGLCLGVAVASMVTTVVDP